MEVEFGYMNCKNRLKYEKREIVRGEYQVRLSKKLMGKSLGGQ